MEEGSFYPKSLFMVVLRSQHIVCLLVSICFGVTFGVCLINVIITFGATSLPNFAAKMFSYELG